MYDNGPPSSPNPVHLTPPDRSKRVKDAKSEAQKEIEDYRKQKEEEYQKYDKEVCHATTLCRADYKSLPIWFSKRAATRKLNKTRMRRLRASSLKLRTLATRWATRWFKICSKP